LQTNTTDEYFLESANKISYFFEEGAFVDGDLHQAKELSINKIGHGSPLKVLVTHGARSQTLMALQVYPDRV
jgi:hypothetical protein